MDASTLVAPTGRMKTNSRRFNSKSSQRVAVIALALLLLDGIFVVFRGNSPTIATFAGTDRRTYSSVVVKGDDKPTPSSSLLPVLLDDLKDNHDGNKTEQNLRVVVFEGGFVAAGATGKTFITNTSEDAKIITGAPVVQIPWDSSNDDKNTTVPPSHGAVVEEVHWDSTTVTSSNSNTTVPTASHHEDTDATSSIDVEPRGQRENGQVDDDSQSSITNKTTKGTENENTNNNKAPPALYIVGSDWAEGIAAWRTSVAEVMILAKRINATLVAPDIQQGRLVTPGTGNMPFFELFDRSLLEQYHNQWATAEEYEYVVNQTRSVGGGSVKIFDWCIAVSRRPLCSNGGSYNRQQLQYSDALKNSMQARDQGESSSDVVVLRLSNMWKTSFKDLRLSSEEGQQGDHRLIVPQNEADSIVKNNFRFSKSVHDLAEQTLTNMNISSSAEFAVIHWRAELDHIDYERCADSIVQAKEAMAMRKDTPFVLMSSLSLDESTMWGGARVRAANSTAQLALSKLIYQHGFRMSDNILSNNNNKPKDMIIYAAVDLLLAQKAASFSTCTKECERRKSSAYNSCGACNYQGSFAKLALGEKGRENDRGRARWPCWPRNASDWPAIQSLW